MLVVGVLAAVGFVVLRLVVVRGGGQPLAADVTWHDLMLAMLTPAGTVMAWIPAMVGGAIGMIIIEIVLEFS